MPTLLYTRRGCHLCEAAEDILATAGIDAESVDVDRDPSLAAAFGLRVPVLEVDGAILIEGRFDEERAAAVFARLRGRA